jgi:CBS-domain-containing membrane protein
MNAIREPIHNLTAEDVMHRDMVVVPQQMLMREAANLLYRAAASEAPVVDEHGRCVGMLTPANVFRWIEAGCPEVVVGQALHCPYQVQGCLLTGHEAVICILAGGSCPSQKLQPTIGGGHTAICTPKGTELPPSGAVPPYMKTEIMTVRPHTPLLQLVRQIIDACADLVIVLDEFGRPIGIVSATDVSSTITDGGGRDRDSGDPVAQGTPISVGAER